MRFALPLALLAAPASGQVLYTFTGSLSEGQLGATVDGLGDVDGDGLDDFLVTQPGKEPSGRLFVRSGVDGALLYIVNEPVFPDNGFASAASGIGDVDFDGRGDFAVGAWLDDTAGNNAGRVAVYSGIDGALLYELLGLVPDGVFGYRVSRLSDVDGDLVGDLLVGAPNATGGVAGSGYVTIHSGVDGALLRTLAREPGDHAFGRSLADAGDVNGDGVGDVLIGLEFDDTNGADAGAARVYSGFDGSILHDLTGDLASDHFGRAVDGVGDVNSDGRDDFLVGASGSDVAGELAGLVRLYSGIDGAVLQEWSGLPDEALGDKVAGVGDLDGDGLNDVALVSTRSHIAGWFFGQVSVYSSATGALLRMWHGDESLSSFGGGLADAGDVNGDGVPDVLIGASSHGNGASAPGSGKVWALSGSLAPLDAYCFADGQDASCPCGNLDPDAGCAHAGGFGARLLVTGSASLSANDLVFTLLDAPPSTFGVIAAGAGSVSLPVGNGSLCVGTPVYRSAVRSTQSFGAFALGPGLPLAVLAGGSSNAFQAYYRDVGGPCGTTVNFSNAVRVTWLP